MWTWRWALGADKLDCPGCQRLVRAAAERGAARTRGKQLPPQQVERRRRTAAELDLGQYLRPGCNFGPWWTRGELALLGKLPDEEVAARIGRTPEAVRCKRSKMGIPTACDRRRRG